MKIPKALNKTTSHINEQNLIEKQVGQLQTQRAEVTVKQAVAIDELPVGSPSSKLLKENNTKKLRKCFHSLLTHANTWGCDQNENYSKLEVNIESVIRRLFIASYLIAYNFDKDPN